MADKNTSGLATLAEDPYALPAEEAAAATQPAGALVKSTGKTLAPVGNIAMDPTQTAELLANMQQMVDDRTGAGSQFMRGLERASAWGSGGAQGPAQTLAVLNAQQQKEDESVFGMRQQMAALKSAAAQQEAFAKQKTSELGGGTGTGGGTAGGASTFGTIAGLPKLAQEALVSAKTPEEYNKMKARFAELSMNPEWSKPVEYVNAAGEIDKAPLYIAVSQAKQGDPRNAAVFGGKAPTAGGKGVSPDAVEFVESRGNPKAVSPAGAEGTMQVMPNTQTDPGFGVVPAKDKSPEELKRVGRDYFQAMKDRYKDDTLASIAYNMGPGKTDDWLTKTNGNFKALPAETQSYIGQVHTANAMLNRGQAQPAELPSQRPSFSEATAQAEARKARLQEEGKVSAESSKKEQETFRENTSVSNVADTARTAADMKAILKELGPDSKLLSVFNEPGMASAIGRLITTGIATPIGSVSMPDFARAAVTAKPGVTKRDLELLDEFDSVMARVQTAVAQANKGQGSTSDAERQLFKSVGGSSLNSYQMLERAQKAMDAKSRFNEQAGDMMAGMHRPGRPVDWADFKNSTQYRALEKQYINELKDISKTIPQKPGQPAATGEQQPAAPKWNHTDSEYEAWKKSKGIK